MTPIKFTAIIPARYASSRFPGKPLAMIGGSTMIERVYRQVNKTVDDVWVATDDTRIFDTVCSFGGKAVMTSPDHQSGTDRIREAAEAIAPNTDVIINVQGDEPFIAPEQIKAIMDCFDNNHTTTIATLARRFDPQKGFEALFDPNLVKIVFNDKMEALYFSRSIIPYVRGAGWKEWLATTTFHTHIGMYAYRLDTLREITSIPRSSLEIDESLEQLRWLQNGYRIKVALTNLPTIGIDTPEDLQNAIVFAKEFDKSDKWT